METHYMMVEEPPDLLRIDEAENAWFAYTAFDEDVDIDLPPRSDILKDSEIGEG